jgi:flagellar motility protein MotE (MotC chaperone)
VNKKLIIIAAIAGLISFGGMFGIAWLTKSSAESPSTEAPQPTPAAKESIPESPQPQITPAVAEGESESKMKKAMTEKQLKSLVFEVREKIKEYDSKLEELKLHEQRLQIVQDTLKKDIEQLDNLRIELASTVASIKEERDKLLKSRVEIAQEETNNLMSIAAAYDKMDAEAAGKILTNMSQAQNNNADDAVKILYYMTERTRAKLLAQMATSEPNLAAVICHKLKQITEGK